MAALSESRREEGRENERQAKLWVFCTEGRDGDEALRRILWGARLCNKTDLPSLRTRMFHSPRAAAACPRGSVSE